jgi:hypothetical protein
MRIIASIALATASVRGSSFMGLDSDDVNCQAQVTSTRIDVDELMMERQNAVMTAIDEFREYETVATYISNAAGPVRDRLDIMQEILVSMDCPSDVIEAARDLEESIDNQLTREWGFFTQWLFLRRLIIDRIATIEYTMREFDDANAEKARIVHSELIESIDSIQEDANILDSDAKQFFRDQLVSQDGVIAELRRRVDEAEENAVRRWEDGAETREMWKELRAQQDKELEVEKLRIFAADKVRPKIVFAGTEPAAWDAVRDFDEAVQEAHDAGKIDESVDDSIKAIRKELVTVRECISSVLNEIKAAKQGVTSILTEEAVFEAMTSGYREFTSLYEAARKRTADFSMSGFEVCKERAIEEARQLGVFLSNHMEEVKRSVERDPRYQALDEKCASALQEAIQSVHMAIASEIKQRFAKPKASADGIIRALLMAELPKYRKQIREAAKGCTAQAGADAEKAIGNLGTFIREEVQRFVQAS